MLDGSGDSELSYTDILSAKGGACMYIELSFEPYIKSVS